MHALQFLLSSFDTLSLSLSPSLSITHTHTHTHTHTNSMSFFSLFSTWENKGWTPVIRVRLWVSGLWGGRWWWSRWGPRGRRGRRRSRAQASIEGEGISEPWSVLLNINGKLKVNTFFPLIKMRSLILCNNKWNRNFNKYCSYIQLCFFLNDANYVTNCCTEAIIKEIKIQIQSLIAWLISSEI